MAKKAIIIIVAIIFMFTLMAVPVMAAKKDNKVDEALKDSIKSRIEAGEDLGDIVKSSIEAGNDPYEVIRAIIEAGEALEGFNMDDAAVTEVVTAAVDLGVTTDVVMQATNDAGVNPLLVARVISGTGTGGTQGGPGYTPPPPPAPESEPSDITTGPPGGSSSGTTSPSEF
jgi:hypothetical protein